MARKKTDAHQKHLELNHYYRTLANTLGTNFPDLEKIVVNCTFIDPDSEVSDIHSQPTYTPDSKDWFTFLCPYVDCKMGGFDIGTTIRQALRNHRTKGEGKEICQGNFDSWKCHCKLLYSFEITYSTQPKL